MSWWWEGSGSGWGGEHYFSIGQLVLDLCSFDVDRGSVLRCGHACSFAGWRILLLSLFRVRSSPHLLYVLKREK